MCMLCAHADTVSCVCEFCDAWMSLHGSDVARHSYSFDTASVAMQLTRLACIASQHCDRGTGMYDSCVVMRRLAHPSKCKCDTPYAPQECQQYSFIHWLFLQSATATDRLE